MTTPLPTPLATAAPGDAIIQQPGDPIEWLEATALLHDYVEWLRAAVRVDPIAVQPALGRELADLAGQYDGQRSILFLAHLDLGGRRLAAGTVAIRLDDDGGAELKRMYLRPMARGLGLADRLVAHAVAEAGARGARTVWLESLPGVMEPALAVYRRNGFVDAGGQRTIGVDGIVTLERPIPPEAADRR